MVKLRNCSIAEFFQKNKNKIVYAFGDSKRIRTYTFLRVNDYDIIPIIYEIVDNDSNKWGKVNDINKMVISPNELRQTIRRDDVILITSMYYGEILKQLDSYQELDNVECYILNYIDDAFDSVMKKDLFERCKSDDYVIPPVIHYCWFGDAPIPQQYMEYIETWKEKCPNYQIKKWDESNYDVNKHPFMKWAYENRKWAFVPDYARLDIIYNYGGIYLDTDVEVIKNLDDLRKVKAFAGFESTQRIAFGLGFGSNKGNEVIRKLRDMYDNVLEENKKQVIPSPVYQTRGLVQMGVSLNNTFQTVNGNEMVIFPTEVLCGQRMNTKCRQITNNTHTIHHYAGDWGGKEIKDKSDNVRNIYCEKIWDRIDNSRGK